MSHVPPSLGPPTFLVGAERSGTTLLRLMLDHHPEISFQFEFELAVDFIPDEGGWPDVAEYSRRMSTNRGFLDSRYEIDPELDYPSLVRSFLEQKRQRDAKPRVGATVHRHFDRLLRVWPEARFVHIYRDGRDVARSCIAMGWAGNVWTGVARWIEAETLWKELRARLSPDRYTEVRYETLIAEPESVLRGLCDFMGVPFDRAMFDYAKTSTYEAPDPRLASQWKRSLSPREIQLVESRIGDMLAERGYEPSGLPRIRVSAAERAALRIQDRLSRARNRLADYGPRLFLENVVAKRVGTQGWRDDVQRRINAVELRKLK